MALLTLTIVLPLGRGASLGPKDDGKSSSEKGRFDIYVAGEKIGEEKFSIRRSPDSIKSSSVLYFRDPARRNLRVRIETQLTMDPEYRPKSYQLDTDIGEQKVTMTGIFVPGQADFEYRLDGIARKRGLLVGDSVIMLDTNVFHHFAFIPQLLDFDKGNSRTVEVIIPQELANGIIKVVEAGVEETSIRGKKRELHHLKVDSGALLMDLWTDDHKILYKIALPAKGIEVIRNR